MSSSPVTLRVRAQRHERDDLLAEPRVRPPHHPGQRDGRVGKEHILDVPREDVEPAAQDQVLLPVHHVEVAVGVQVADTPVCSQPFASTVAANSGACQ